MHQQLTEAGKMLGIKVLDHLIIAKKGFYRFQEAGLTPRSWSCLTFTLLFSTFVQTPFESSLQQLFRSAVQGVKIHFRYDPQKGLAILEYLLKQVGGRYNQMALLKLAFFADRYHVREYARPVSSDEYYALKLGPVPSNLKDILSTEEYLSDKFHFPGAYAVELKTTDIDLDQFSKSDVEAMKFAVDHFAEMGRNDEFFLAHLTHAYPEWDKYRERFSTNHYGREEMDYRDFLLNADLDHPEFRKLNFRDPFPALTDEEREDIYNEMLERTIAFA